MSWSDERVELLKKLWMEGLSAAQIAGEIGGGVTRNAVIGKVHRLKLSARAKPNGSKTRPASRTPRNNPAARRAAAQAPRTPSKEQAIPAADSTPLGDPRSRQEKPEVEEAPEPFTPENKRLTLLDLTEHTCKWPIGDPLEPDFYFCGRPPTDDHPYCEFHARRAYHQVDRKER